jgi:hypothetical protein
MKQVKVKLLQDNKIQKRFVLDGEVETKSNVIKEKDEIYYNLCVRIKNKNAAIEFNFNNATGFEAVIEMNDEHKFLKLEHLDIRQDSESDVVHVTVHNEMNYNLLEHYMLQFQKQANQ